MHRQTHNLLGDLLLRKYWSKLYTQASFAGPTIRQNNKTCFFRLKTFFLSLDSHRDRAKKVEQRKNNSKCCTHALRILSD